MKVAPPSEIPAFVGNFVSARLIKLGPVFLKTTRKLLSGGGRLRSKEMQSLSGLLVMRIYKGTEFSKMTKKPLSGAEKLRSRGMLLLSIISV